ncbi:unnamed protein product [Prunus armeniaca]
MRVAMEATVIAAKDAETAKKTVQMALEEYEHSKAAEIEATVPKAMRGYRSSEEFTILLDKEVGSEMADLLQRFKRYSPEKKLNLNFFVDPPPLPKCITEEMIEDYEGEDAPEEASAAEGPATADAAINEDADVADKEAAT